MDKFGVENKQRTERMLSPLEWLTEYIHAIEKADTSCEQKLILTELKAVRHLLGIHVGKTESNCKFGVENKQRTEGFDVISSGPEEVTVGRYIPEFIDKLIEQLKSDHDRWGNTWLKRPKEGQEQRTKSRFTDYFDMFENAGIPVPWMKIVGGALICWIRDNHPELCIDADECEDEGKPKLRPGTIEEYLKDQRRPIGTPASIKSPFRDERKLSEDKAVEEMTTKESGRPFEPVGKYPIMETIKMVEKRVEEKAVEDMTTKELVESPQESHARDLEETAIEATLPNQPAQHKSDCAVHNEPAIPASKCNCQDCNLPEIEEIVNPIGEPGKEFGKASQEATDKAIVEALKNSPRSNPVAHVYSKILDSWRTGCLVSPHGSNGKIIRESAVFTTGSMGEELVLARCDKDGFIARGSEKMWIEGTLGNNGRYVIAERCGFDPMIKYTLFVSYDYEFVGLE